MSKAAALLDWHFSASVLLQRWSPEGDASTADILQNSAFTTGMTPKFQRKRLMSKRLMRIMAPKDLQAL
jgi:hypothetical protein